MTCQCGLPLTPNRARPDVRECGHCDRACMAPGACLRCGRSHGADGVGPKTRPGR